MSCGGASVARVNAIAHIVNELNLVGVSENLEIALIPVDKTNASIKMCTHTASQRLSSSMIFVFCFVGIFY